MTDIHLVYYGFSFLIVVILIISARGINRNHKSNDVLMILLWGTLASFAIMHWIGVSHYTDADTIAFHWLGAQLELVWETIDQITQKTKI
jgi:hypothetical protein